MFPMIIGVMNHGHHTAHWSHFYDYLIPSNHLHERIQYPYEKLIAS